MTEQPAYESPANVGDLITVSEFAFVNAAGGTGMSDWEFNEKFSQPARVQIVKLFWDYECGWRFHAIAMDDDLKAYLTRNAAKDDHRIFVSEFDILTGEK